jgi:hypothetical protein
MVAHNGVDFYNLEVRSSEIDQVRFLLRRSPSLGTSRFHRSSLPCATRFATTKEKKSNGFPASETQNKTTQQKRTQHKKLQRLAELEQKQSDRQLENKRIGQFYKAQLQSRLAHLTTQRKRDESASRTLQERIDKTSQQWSADARQPNQTLSSLADQKQKYASLVCSLAPTWDAASHKRQVLRLHEFDDAIAAAQRRTDAQQRADKTTRKLDKLLAQKASLLAATKQQRHDGDENTSPSNGGGNGNDNDAALDAEIDMLRARHTAAVALATGSASHLPPTYASGSMLNASKAHHQASPLSSSAASLSSSSSAAALASTVSGVRTALALHPPVQRFASSIERVREREMARERDASAARLENAEVEEERERGRLARRLLLSRSFVISLFCVSP